MDGTGTADADDAVDVPADAVDVPADAVDVPADAGELPADAGELRADAVDVVVLGTSHDALISAAYLARAGRRVAVIAETDRLGGCLSTIDALGARVSTGELDHLMINGTSIVDDLELRQAIEKQLNKIELANRFTRAVAVGNPREFTQAEKEEQEIAESCNRLIKNSIVCWNYLYLTRKLERTTDSEEKERLRQIIVAHSPMSWAHINMLGEYDFSDEKLRDSVGILPLKSVA